MKQLSLYYDICTGSYIARMYRNTKKTIRHNCKLQKDKYSLYDNVEVRMYYYVELTEL